MRDKRKGDDMTYFVLNRDDDTFILTFKLLRKRDTIKITRITSKTKNQNFRDDSINMKLMDAIVIITSKLKNSCASLLKSTSPLYH